MLETIFSSILVLFSVSALRTNSYLSVVISVGTVLVSVYALYLTNISQVMCGILCEDGLSSSMLFLTAYICFLSVFVNCAPATSSCSSDVVFISLIFIINFFLVISFSVSSLLWFYVFFEASLIPVLFMIISWGGQPERLQAGMSMIIYTIVGSLPFLIIIFYIQISEGHCKLSLFSVETIGLTYGWVFLLGVFLIKLPVFSVHMWLPKAHVEAPLSGSMLLAAILLKLGGYGILRIITAFSYNYIPWFSFILSISLIGGVLLSIQCIRQLDINSLIAYSSICHMSFVLGGILSNNEIGWKAALLGMVSHGFSSSALFVLANLCYENMGSRSLLLIGGLFSFCPSICLFLFLFIIINSGTPPFVNFYNEIFLINSVSYMWPLIGFPLVFSLFFSFLYNVYLYVSVAHGKQPAANSLCNDFITLIVLFIHAFPLLIFVWVPSIFFDAIL